jgi:hypothetical protein
MVRAEIAGVFPTYKTLSDGSRRTYWYHRATGRRLNGEPCSPEFFANYARAEEFLKSRLNGDNFIGLIPGRVRFRLCICLFRSSETLPWKRFKDRRALDLEQSRLRRRKFHATDPQTSEDFSIIWCA